LNTDFTRPHPFMIQRPMKNLSVEYLEKVVRLSDTRMEIEEDMNSGCAIVIAFTTGLQSKEDLAKSWPHYIIETQEYLLFLIP
jgi:phosphoglycolate phosphatase-like HAD superfamily hydrolase